MSEIDLYEIGAELLGHKAAEGAADRAAIRLGALQAVIDQVNAVLVQNNRPAQRGTKKAGRAPHQGIFMPSMGGKTKLEAAGAIVSSPQPDDMLPADLVPPVSLTSIHPVPESRSTPIVLVPMGQDPEAARSLPDPVDTDAAMAAKPLTTPEFFSLLAEVGQGGMGEAHAMPALFARSKDLPATASWSQALEAPGAFHASMPANVVKLPPDPFPWRVAGIGAGPETPAPLRKKAAGDVVDRGRFARTGGPTRRAVEGASHSIVPAEMSRGPDRAAGGGGIIEDTWRRMHRSGGKAGAVAGDSAYLIEAGGSGADSFGVIGAIVTATLAVATEQLAARDQPQGRAPSSPNHAPVPGSAPDWPLYTRIVTDQSPIPTMVTNHDALTSVTVNMLAQHQSAMPTAPTGLNNNLVPPAPGVPAPGSYHP